MKPYIRVAMRGRRSCTTALVALLACWSGRGVQGSAPLDTARLEGLQKQFEKSDAALKACKRGGKLPLDCAQKLVQELAKLDEYRAESATRDSVRELRRAIKLAVLALYVDRSQTESAQRWFREQMQVRPPTDAELLEMGPRLSEFAQEQTRLLAAQGERWIHFEAPEPCMVFVNGSEVDRKFLLPLGNYEVYSVNPTSLEMSEPKRIKLGAHSEPFAVKLNCGESSEPKVEDTEKIEKAEERSNGESQPATAEPRIEEKRHIVVSEKHKPRLDNEGLPVRGANPGPKRILPRPYELIGMGAGLLAVIGGSIGLAYDKKCWRPVRGPNGECPGFIYNEFSRQSIAAISVGGAVFLASAVLLIIDERREKKAKASGRRTARTFKFESGVLRF